MTRIRLTTSRPPGYRRGGQVIGNQAAPTVVDGDELEPAQTLALLRDPNVTIEVEVEDGRFERMSQEDRDDAIAAATEALAEGSDDDDGKDGDPPPPPPPPPPVEHAMTAQTVEPDADDKAPPEKAEAAKAPAKKPAAKKAPAKSSPATATGKGKTGD